MAKKRKYGTIDGVWQIDPDDQALFDRIARESASENEKHFFRVVEYREKHNQSTPGDILLDCRKNPDGIGIIRYEYDMYKFLILNVEYGWGKVLVSTDTLCSFLNMDMTKYHLYERTGYKTLFEYLRSIDYAGIDYEADNDD